MKILFYGNCNLHSMYFKLKLDNSMYIACYSNEYTEDTFNKIIQSCDIIITQPINDNYKEKSYLSTTNIINTANKNCRIVILQSFRFDFYYIDLKYIPYENEYLNIPCSYHHDYMVECFKNNLDPNHYIHNYVYNDSLRTTIELEKIADESINELKKRFDESKIKYNFENVSFIHAYEFIKENYKKKLLFYSMNHPTKYLIEYSCEQILQTLQLHCEIDYTTDYLAGIKCIIYNCIQKVVDFNIKNHNPLINDKTDIYEITNLYYNAYNSINLK